MRKENEIQNPRSCLNKAHDGEMLFVLLARDAAAPAIIRFWVDERIRLGLNGIGDLQVTEALQCMIDMEKQRAAEKENERER